MNIAARPSLLWLSPLLWRASLRYQLRHPWQLFLALLGIGLGVAVVVAVDLANDSAKLSFKRSLDRVVGSATHRIYGGSRGVPEAFYRSLRLDKDLPLLLAPVVAGFAAVEGRPGEVYQVLGVDPLAEGPFRGAQGTPTDSGSGAGVAAAVADLLGHPRSAFVPPELHGEPFVLVAGRGRLTATPVAAVDDPQFQGFVVVDISTAQELFDRTGHLSHIDVIAPDRGGEKALATLVDRLPEGSTLELAAERGEATASLSAAFRLNLTAMSLMALLVGVFLVYNAMAFAVVQRRGLIGRLRALGVTRGEIFTATLGEAALLGAVGALLGVALGVVLGWGLMGLVVRTISDLYAPLPVQAFALDGGVVLQGVLIGLGATLLGAVLPAREAALVTPGNALQRADLESRWRRYLLPLGLMAGCCAAVGGMLLAVDGGLWWAFAGLFALLMACALTVPAAVDGAARGVGALAAGRSRLAAMATRAASRHLSRTGVAVAALTIAFATAVGVGVLVDSFRSGVIIWLSDLLNADLYVIPQALEPRAEAPPLAPETLERLKADPAVAHVSTFTPRRVPLEGGFTLLVAADLAPEARRGYRFNQGQPRAAWAAFEEGAVLISEPLAYRRDLTLGDSLTLSTDRGPRTLPIAGVFHDYASEHGRVFIHRDTFAQLFDASPPESAAVYAHPGSDLKALQGRLVATAGTVQALSFTTPKEIFDLSLTIFDRTFTVTSVLRLLAIVVAMVGLVSALTALQLERGREYATLRAMGMTPGEVGRLTLVETGFLGLLAGLLAIPVGLLLAAGLIYVIHRRSFGWTMPFEVDPGLLIQGVGLAVVAALVAGIIPAVRSAYTPPARALGEG